MSQINEAEFTGWRKLLWPIHTAETKKFLPMGIMMFCILLIYTLLRDTKDSLLVNAVGAGAESLGFAKLTGVTTAAVVFFSLYTKAANIFSREGLFYATAVPFLVFFGIYPYAIHPFYHLIHMDLSTIQYYQQWFDQHVWWGFHIIIPFSRIIPLIGNWSITLFYILSELWGSAVLSLLFWQFANAITPVHQAKRFYGMFGFVGNFGLIFSGPAIIILTNYIESLALERHAGTGLMLRYLMGIVVVAGAILLATFYWMNRAVLTDIRHYNPEEMGEKKKKEKLSIGESLKCIVQSPYLGLVAMLVLSYGISINLFEAVWKGQIKILYPTEVEYNRVMGWLSTITGVVSVLLMLVGSNLLRRFSWKRCAMITPVILFIGTLIFFGVIHWNNHHLPAGLRIEQAVRTGLFPETYVYFAILVGLVANGLGKAVKYSLFDPTKEMAYIPLDFTLKTKGKAAVDVIGGRGGKSAGSAFQWLLLAIYPQAFLYQLVPVIAPIVVGIVFLWLLSVVRLSKRFEQLTHEKASSTT